jgi:hypothetical protein
MLSDFRLVAALLIAGMALVLHPACLKSQEASQGPNFTTQDLPEAPQPQIEVALAEPRDQQPAGEQGQQAQPPAQVSTPAQDPATNSPVADSSSSSSGTPTVLTPTDKSKHQKAEEQIKQQEHQRVMGIIPAFNISYRGDAVSLTPAEKVRLAFHSTIDPYAFGLAFIVAGLGEAKGDNPGFGWGPEGYAKRSGAAYLDAFDGTMIGNAFLPIMLHQDPRYFRLGHGSASHRFFYAVATSFICKHDNTGQVGAQLLQCRGKYHLRCDLQSLLPRQQIRCRADLRSRDDRDIRRNVWRDSPGVLAGYLPEDLPQGPDQRAGCPGSRRRRGEKESQT